MSNLICEFTCVYLEKAELFFIKYGVCGNIHFKYANKLLLFI